MTRQLIVPLPEDAPIPHESIPAEPVGVDQWRVLAAPFVTYDVCRGDVVRVSTDPAGEPTFVEIVNASGAHTVRLLLAKDLDLMGRMAVMMALKERGLVGEEPKGRYYSLTLPAEADLESALEVLESQAGDGAHEFEVFSSSGTA
ncbi:MAG: DUF4265 domain-containing protein [Myxococcota bacterium]